MLTNLTKFHFFGVDVFGLSNKYLVYNLIARNLKIKYRHSYLGLFWTILIPAANAVVYWAVFQFIMKIKIENYFLFIISGIMSWNFFASGLTQGMEALVGNHSLLNKIPISPLVFPLSEVLTSFVNFSFSLPILMGVILFTKAPLTWALLQVLLFWGLLFLQAYSFSIILSIGFVYFRDLRHLMSIAIQMWMYLTPVLYSTDMLPDSFRKIIYFNPVAILFHGVHISFIKGEWLPLPFLFICTLWTLFLLSASIVLYRFFHKILVERI